MTVGAWVERARRVGTSAPVAVALLVAANLVPLAGVLFFGWDVAAILILYWLENGIVGLINVPKILLAADRTDALSTVGAADNVVGRVVLAAFFLVHYGIFWVGHGVFVMFLTGRPFFAVDIVQPMRAVAVDRGLVIAAAALFASHAMSFFLNYVGRREYLSTTVGRQMFAPYPRMVVLHLTILGGGLLIQLVGQPIALLVLLVLFKTVFDLSLHLREHARRGSPVMQAVPEES